MKENKICLKIANYDHFLNDENRFDRKKVNKKFLHYRIFPLNKQKSDVYVAYLST